MHQAYGSYLDRPIDLPVSVEQLPRLLELPDVLRILAKKNEQI